MKKTILYIILFLQISFAQAAVDSIINTKAKVAADTVETIQDTVKAESNKLVENIKPPIKVNEIFSLTKIIWTIIFIFIGYNVIKLITTLLDKLSERSISYRITIKGFIPIVKIIGWIGIFTLVIVGIFQPPMESVLLVAGSLGIAIGFAAQDILKNIFGGITIIFDKAFQVGDKIQVGEYYGEVTSIGLRSTRIVTQDDSMVVLPNGELMAQSISNSNSGEPNCQVVSEIYLPPYIDTALVRKIAIQSAQVSRYVYLNKPIAVRFKNEIYESRSVLKLRLKAYVLDIRYEFAFMSDMTETVIKELLRLNIITKDELIGFQKLN